MAFENLSEREKEVLTNLINYYINTADPVGSRVIANRFKMGVSSATIRNTLQDLEEMGLVKQPHTSAGRVPTDLGYRVYVDYLLKPERLPSKERKKLRQSILEKGRGVNEILGQTCRVLGDITHQLGVTIAPKFDAGLLRRIELIPVAEGKLMVVVVVDSGLARTVIIEVEASIPDNELIQVAAILNERLAGLSLGEIRQTITKRLADVTGNGRLINLLVDARDRIWVQDPAGDIKISGADHLLSQPEFSDLGKVADIIKLMENSQALSEFLAKYDKEGLIITIGRENPVHEIIECSLVSASYSVGNIKGSVAVIGPTRMEYSKLVSVVEYTARTITEVLGGDGSESEEDE